MAGEDVNEWHGTPVFLRIPCLSQFIGLPQISHVGFCRNKILYFSNLELVEAAGVEPASENVTGQEPTCVVAFMPWALPRTFAARAQNGQETRSASL